MLQNIAAVKQNCLNRKTRLPSRPKGPDFTYLSHSMKHLFHILRYAASWRGCALKYDKILRKNCHLQNLKERKEDLLLYKCGVEDQTKPN